MLLLAIALALPAQGPRAIAASDRPTTDLREAVISVRGSVELSAAAADAAAMKLAVARLRDQVANDARELIARVGPRWLPEFRRERALERWLAGVEVDELIEVVDAERDVHDHGGLGKSYRTTVHLQPDRQRWSDDLRRLRRSLPAAARAFAVGCGGILAFWLFLGLACAWLDRLTRGYMTWRLRVLGAAAGLALPAALLLV